MGLDDRAEDRAHDRAHDGADGEEVTGQDPAGPARDPLADVDAGVAVDDDPGQVALNTDQWDSE